MNAAVNVIQLGLKEVGGPPRKTKRSRGSDRTTVGGRRRQKETER